ncbi:LacI family DNA-binding transcriptional regulator [Fulvivirgaceae bacterium BMA10]|uniref:LacI family DNA-binding transcriptional regulator n=1 Tax=Splendidivirga corallicola TaxID=3051826 RepID=A0ABT8KUI8_9BACT|nr:LacI family DNA-binding transcriptional regulator [Fulvivirgaceae bacterium BMA10]
MKGGQVTIKDIARELDISPSTVSRALKDHPDISPETKKAVNELAKKLHYQPNSIAQSLRKSKTNTIGIIVPEIVHFFFSTVISGIEDVAYNAGYNVIICQSNESYEREVSDTFALLSHRVDGLLISLSRNTKNFDHFREVYERGIPMVFFDRICEELDTHRIVVDDKEGAFKAVEHLISIGCKRIAHIEGPRNLVICQQRLEGYKQALEQHGLPYDEDLVVIDNVGSRESGFERGQQLLKLDNPPDAVFAHNDMAAHGVMLAIKEAGLKIPEDIAVAGFSNWQFSSLIQPSLTTVAQPGFEMGREAARMFIDQVKQDKEDFQAQTQLLKTELIIRESTVRA